MIYRAFVFIMAFMLIGIGGYYLFQQRTVFGSLSQNKKETSDILNEQIRLATIDNGSSVDTSSSTETSSTTDRETDAIAGELIAGNYSSDTGIEVILKRNKKVLFVVPDESIKKGSWQIISNNVLSVSMIHNGTATKYLFSIEDPEREIVEIKVGDPVIYTRK